MCVMTRFGVQLPNFSGFDSADLFEHMAGLATAAEDSGFDSVWVMDHFFQLPPLGGPDQPMMEAYTLLGALAARTSRVQLGTLVTGVTYRNPGILAKIVTTLDVISRGRAILGIGGAWYDVEHQGLGVDYPGDRVRLDMLEEAVQICRAMFTGDDVSFSGTHYRLDHARNLPRPVQAGGPKIMIGGGGEKRTLRLVAQYADMCNVTGDASTLARKIERAPPPLRRGRPGPGRGRRDMDDPADPDHLQPEHGRDARTGDSVAAPPRRSPDSPSASPTRSPAWSPVTSRPAPTRSSSASPSPTPRESLPWRRHSD